MKLIAGNWKMNGALAQCRTFAQDLLEQLTPLQRQKCQIVLAPPYPYFSFLEGRLVSGGVLLAGQDCAPWGQSGAYTGDVSAAMLRDVGCTHVILGHSERRQRHGETDALVLKKMTAAWDAGLTPILCIGETAAENESGQTKAVLERQLASLKEAPADAPLIIAYEPVWAIGTGKVPNTQEIQETCAHIAAVVEPVLKKPPCVLYGGSVSGENATAILQLPTVHGALVGGASLKPAEFLKIIEAAC